MRGFWTKERLAVAIITVITTVVLALPAVFGWWHGVQIGQTWNGQVLSPEDYGYYLSLIQQAEDGHILARNLYTSEQTTPMLNVFWLLVGWLGRAFALPSFLAYHVARVGLVPALCIASYAFLGVFLRDVRERLVAWVLFLFAGGVGLALSTFAPMLLPPGGLTAYDLCVAEVNAFSSMLYSPHFIASLIMLLLCVWTLLLAFEHPTRRNALATGVCFIVLFLFHPYHAITLYALAGVILAVESLYHGRLDHKQIRALGLILAVSVPVLLYFFFVTRVTPADRDVLAQSVTKTGSFLNVAYGLGFLIPFAMYGAWVSRHRLREFRWRALLVWAVSVPAILYVPFDFQRRLVEGWSFPLAILSGVAIMHLAAWMRKRVSWPLFAFVCGCGVVMLTGYFLPTNAKIYEKYFSIIDQEAHVYIDQDQWNALQWMHANVPEDAVVVGMPDDLSRVAAFAARDVYAGHWANTINGDQKRQDLAAFFGSWSEAHQYTFLTRTGITHVIIGPLERAAGWDDAMPPAWARPLYTSGNYTVYAFSRP